MPASELQAERNNVARYNSRQHSDYVLSDMMALIATHGSILGHAERHDGIHCNT